MPPLPPPQLQYCNHCTRPPQCNTVIFWGDPSPPIRDYVIYGQPLRISISVTGRKKMLLILLYNSKVSLPPKSILLLVEILRQFATFSLLETVAMRLPPQNKTVVLLQIINLPILFLSTLWVNNNMLVFRNLKENNGLLSKIIFLVISHFRLVFSHLTSYLWAAWLIFENDSFILSRLKAVKTVRTVAPIPSASNSPPFCLVNSTESASWKNQWWERSTTKEVKERFQRNGRYIIDAQG